MDIFSPRMHEFPVAERAVFTLGVRLPVVALDGQPRIAGGLSLEMIGSALEQRGLTALE